MGLWTAGARAALFALRDGYLSAPGLTETAARSLLDDLFRGALLCVPAAWLLARLGRHGTRPSRGVAALASLALAWGFVGAQWPSSPWHAPGWDSGRAWMAHAASLVTAVVAALALRPGAARGLRHVCTLGAGLSATAAAVAVALLLVGPTADAARPSVVLVSVDTLRADHLGAYGDTRGLTPALDALATESVRFERAYTPQPFTLNAHMSLLTGLSPSVHALAIERALPHAVTTLAQAFATAGYVCLAVVDTVPWLHPRYGFGRGFHKYLQVEGDAAVKDSVVRMLLDDVGDQPVFLFVHVYDAHSDEQRLPYDSTAHDRREIAGWYDGDFDGCDPDLGCASVLLQEWNHLGRLPDEDTRRWLADLYAAGVASVDRRLGVLFDDLRERGLLERSLLLVTADHGEEFYEHGRALHDQNYEECARVPLLVRMPGGRPVGLAGSPVSLLDVPATLTELLALPMPAGQGRSFATAVQASAAARPDLLPAPDGDLSPHALLDSGRGSLGLVTRRWKLIPTRKGFELYDLLADPGERIDLLAPGRTPPAVTTTLLATLERLRADIHARRLALGLPDDPRLGGGRPIESPLSDEASLHLKALGYTSGG